MTKLTRRGALRLGAGGLGAAGLAAGCSSMDAGYSGKVAFNHGVASGDPTQGSVILWTRVTPEGSTGRVPVRWSVARDPEFRTVIRAGCREHRAGARLHGEDRCRRAVGGPGLLLLVHRRAADIAGWHDPHAARQRHGGLSHGGGLVLELAVRIFQCLSRDREAEGHRRRHPSRRLHLRVWRDRIWRDGGQGARPQPRAGARVREARGLSHALCAVPVRSRPAGGACGSAVVLHLGRP